MPFSSIQPVRPRRPQVGAIGTTTATPPSKLPRGPIMARGFARVMAGVAIIAPLPKPVTQVVTKLPAQVLVAKSAPRSVAGRANVGRPLRTPPVVTTKLLRPTLVAKPVPRPAPGRVFIARLPFTYVSPPPVYPRPMTPILAFVKPAPGRGKATIAPLPFPRVAGPFTVSYIDTPPLLGVAYLYRWRTSNGSVYSAYGPALYASASQIPPQVQNFTATPAASQIVLSATPIAYAFTYTIYWSMIPSDPAPAVLIAGLTSPLFVVDPPDTLTRYFAMTASNYCGEGPKSAEVSAAAGASTSGGGAGCAGGSFAGANCSGTTWTGNS